MSAPVSSRRRRTWAAPTVVAAALGSALFAATYTGKLDLQWLSFLAGALLAAGVTIAAQACWSGWRSGSTDETERMREQLDVESARSRNATETMRMADARLRLLGDAVPSLVLYVDRDERCRYHNRAVQDKTGLPADRIDGHPLREITGYAVYPHIAAHIAATLSGKTAEYEFTWDSASGEDENYSVRHVPYFADDPQPRGFYLLLTRAPRSEERGAPSEASAAERAAEAGAEASPLPPEGGETLYVNAIAGELLGEEDPRVKLANALKEDQFLLYAQKILSVKSGTPDPVCYEILLRLQEEEDHMLPPGGFIPAAERYGMMEDLDRWVVRTLIAWSARKLRAEPLWRVPLFCVNLSDAAVRSAQFARYVQGELHQSIFPARALCFEIAEQDVIAHHAAVERLIAALRPAGCRFTIEGFGSAKVSFTYLKGVKVDFIKIDGSITFGILRDPAELAKLRAINTVCQRIGVKTISEFVETKETLEMVREIGVDYVQGFGIARPAPIAQIS